VLPEFWLWVLFDVEIVFAGDIPPMRKTYLITARHQPNLLLSTVDK
jgi:hypothetical protein